MRPVRKQQRALCDSGKQYEVRRQRWVFSLRLSSYYSHFLCQNNTVPGIQGDSILVTNGCPQRGWFHVEETVPLHFTRRAMARGSLLKGWEKSQRHRQSLLATGGGSATGSKPPRSDGRAKRAATGTGIHPKRQAQAQEQS